MIAYNMDHSGILVSKFVCKYCLLGDLPPPLFLLLIVVNISTSSDC